MYIVVVFVLQELQNCDHNCITATITAQLRTGDSTAIKPIVVVMTELILIVVQIVQLVHVAGCSVERCPLHSQVCMDALE